MPVMVIASYTISAPFPLTSFSHFLWREFQCTSASTTFFNTCWRFKQLCQEMFFTRYTPNLSYVREHHSKFHAQMAYPHSSPEVMLSMALSVTECCFPPGTLSKPSLHALMHCAIWLFPSGHPLPSTCAN